MEQGSPRPFVFVIMPFDPAWRDHYEVGITEDLANLNARRRLRRRSWGTSRTIVTRDVRNRVLALGGLVLSSFATRSAAIRVGCHGTRFNTERTVQGSHWADPSFHESDPSPIASHAHPSKARGR
jgi:hypothetical protein